MQSRYIYKLSSFVLAFSVILPLSSYAQTNSSAPLIQEALVGRANLSGAFVNRDSDLYNGNFRKVFIPASWEPYFRDWGSFRDNRDPFFNSYRINASAIKLIKTWDSGKTQYLLFMFDHNKKTRYGLIPVASDYHIQTQSNYVNGIANLTYGVKDIIYVPNSVASKMISGSPDINLVKSLYRVLPIMNVLSEYPKDSFYVYPKKEMADSMYFAENFDFVTVEDNYLSNEEFYMQFGKRVKRTNKYKNDQDLILASYNLVFNELIESKVIPGNYEKDVIKLPWGDLGVPFKTPSGFVYVVLLKGNKPEIVSGKKYAIVPYWNNVFTGNKEAQIKALKYFAITKIASHDGVAYKVDQGIKVTKYTFAEQPLEKFLGSTIMPNAIEELKKASLAERDKFYILPGEQPESNDFILLYHNGKHQNKVFVMQKASIYKLSKNTDGYFLWAVNNLSDLTLKEKISLSTFSVPPKVIPLEVAESLMSNGVPAQLLDLVYVTASSAATMNNDSIVQPRLAGADFAALTFGDAKLKINIEGQIERFNHKAEAYNELTFSLNGKYFSLPTKEKVTKDISVVDFFKSTEIKDYKKRIF